MHVADLWLQLKVQYLFVLASFSQTVQQVKPWNFPICKLSEDPAGEEVRCHAARLRPPTPQEQNLSSVSKLYVAFDKLKSVYVLTVV